MKRPTTVAATNGLICNARATAARQGVRLYSAEGLALARIQASAYLSKA